MYSIFNIYCRFYIFRIVLSFVVDLLLSVAKLIINSIFFE